MSRTDRTSRADTRFDDDRHRANASPRGRRSRFTREEMLERAADLFAKRGYRQTSLTELAEHIGVAKATLFHHFPTKEQILFELYRQAMDIALARIARVDHAGEDPGAIIGAMTREHTLLILENRALFTIFFAEETELEPVHLAQVRSQQRDYINMIARRVEDLIAEGRVRADIHPRIAVQSLLGSASWTYRWVEPDGMQSPEEIADSIADLALNGLLTSS